MKKHILTYCSMFLFVMLAFSVNAQDYTLNMTDSFGDGWNGNSIDITVLDAGATVISTTNFTLAGGTAE